MYLFSTLHFQFRGFVPRGLLRVANYLSSIAQCLLRNLAVSRSSALSILRGNPALSFRSRIAESFLLCFSHCKFCMVKLAISIFLRPAMSVPRYLLHVVQTALSSCACCNPACQSRVPLRRSSHLLIALVGDLLFVLSARRSFHCFLCPNHTCCNPACRILCVIIPSHSAYHNPACQSRVSHSACHNPACNPACCCNLRVSIPRVVVISACQSRVLYSRLS